ncbi:Fe(3+)-hydroxamate ABC transporter permease FhuB [Phyllobacterium sp. 0TCS1.6C]|nr:Fe(3+)-hydroxamate ABC transporter permease FhuB [Phyllobacterium sp. 0TCS1.6C]MCX8281908.1 Fe(3+)-hydroxamate ABC transporter permease FhuB [Phyllobacterium sp. 0TCS1.6C]MCX8295443.1 Fe(3+)-hydroxamate ABC transporter permease FhuB [Phyllobacterium sp. 0TCS1.6A]
MDGVSHSLRPAALVLLLSAVALALAARNFQVVLPAGDWWNAVLHPSEADMRQLMLHYSLLPRLCASLLCGAALGLAGVLFQQVLRNPLAEPGTLGVFAGAKLALAAATLWMPGLLVLGQDTVGFLGGSLAVLLVLALTWKRDLSPLLVILSGLVVSLYLDAISKTLVLVHFDALSDLFKWQAGSLSQNSWIMVAGLLPRLGIAAIIALCMLRPLALLDLDDDGARSVGLSLTAARALAIAVAVVLSAFVAGSVGVIGFIGLAGPAIARYAGARRLGERLVWGPLIAAALLTLADQLVQIVAGGADLPTGSVTALIGAPLLLWLIRKVRAAGPVVTRPRVALRQSARPWRLTVMLLALLLLVLWLTLSLGRVEAGWTWALGDEFHLLMQWRLPRVAAAAAAGLMLSMAGVLLQRVTGNAMASPELLGISAGTALVMIVSVLLLPGADRAAMMLPASLGAFATLLLMLWLGRRSSFAPEHMLLAGIALTTILGAVISVLMFSGDPRIVTVLGWLAGSTYSVTGRDAALVCSIALMMIIFVPLTGRWLSILPLGVATSSALGVTVRRTRLVLLALTAIMTAASTLLVGPLSFIGLMAPHMARMLGLNRPMAQLCAAGLLGAILMVFADWLGRMVAFPWQIPAGIVATCLGGTYFIWLIRK